LYSTKKPPVGAVFLWHLDPPTPKASEGSAPHRFLKNSEA
jgi:hypothetical protein